MSIEPPDPLWLRRRKQPLLDPSSAPAVAGDEADPAALGTAQDTGLDFGLLANLALKTVYTDTGWIT